MSLSIYNKKRDFTKTREPKGQVPIGKKKAQSFVVQEHHASHLHYDFRLEIDGVLKSWAVPKGPSMDPSIKRLAVETEDHPLAYGKFKGRIPKGSYGAGTVKIWDKGSFETLTDPQRAYKKGKIEFTLKGKKLKGDFVLVKSFGGRNWLLIKKNQDQLTNLRSTKSKRKLQNSDACPSFIAPQLALLTEEVPKNRDFIYETKWDGYRLGAHIDGGEVNLFTRENNDWTHRFLPTAHTLSKLKCKNAYLDGEIVYLEGKNKCSFQKLQNAISLDRDKAKLCYVVFDILFLNGNDLRERPLKERKTILARLIKESKLKNVKFSANLTGKPEVLLKSACKQGLEGIIAKEITGPYVSKRDGSWLKLKCQKRQEFVIGGYTDPKGSRKGFGSLLVGYFDKSGKLKYSGHVGTGFNRDSIKDILKLAKKYEQDISPFESDSPKARGIHWLEPKLVCEVKFAEWTDEKILRHPVFTGMREDKSANVIVKESPKAIGNRKTKSVKAAKELELSMLTHPDKILWSEAKMSKLNAVAYYAKVFPLIWPHLIDRPIMLLRCPDGTDGACFYQKRPPEMEGIDTVKLPQITRLEESFAVVRPQGLVSLVQLGGTEIHAWGSKSSSVDHPDQIIFDLDPDEGLPFKKVKKVALLLRDFLSELKLKSFVKLSGGKGLHIHVPIKAQYSWKEVKKFSQLIAEQMQAELPNEIVATMAKAQRKGRVFIDYFRNDFGSTAVLPYSVRAKPNAPLAWPISWNDLEKHKGLTPQSFTMAKVLKKDFKAGLSPWKNYYKLKQLLPRL